MPKVTHSKQKRNYRKKSYGRSVIDDKPTLIVHQYIPPKSYRDAIADVLTAYHSGISFNKAIDQVVALYPSTINRENLVTHTLKTIANDY